MPRPLHGSWEFPGVPLFAPQKAALFAVSHWRVDDNRVGFPGFISRDKVMTILRVLRVYYDVLCVLYIIVCDYTASASPHLPTISSQPPMLVGNRDFALLEKYRASRGEKCIVQSIERCSHFRLVPCSAPWALKVEQCQGMSRCQNGCPKPCSKMLRPSSHSLRRLTT
jgi:hypothetical protein